MTKEILKRIVLYRYNKDNVLEVFLQSPEKLSQKWKLPIKGLKDFSNEFENVMAEYAESMAIQQEEDIILLDPVHNKDGKLEQALALEATDKDSKTYFFPDVKDGKFFEVKEALKKVMPNQYKCLKEVHEIISVRNIIKYF